MFDAIKSLFGIKPKAPETPEPNLDPVVRTGTRVQDWSLLTLRALAYPEGKTLSPENIQRRHLQALDRAKNEAVHRIGPAGASVRNLKRLARKAKNKIKWVRCKPSGTLPKSPLQFSNRSGEV